MTSSLVGSEMCIRDSLPDVEPIQWTCPGCLARRRRAHASHTFLPNEWRSVSYTHLTLPTICSV
eukprot:8067786-Prorocentrum_lima.AAC.1